ncbi:hypothetical protein PHMEG_00036899, partial [Phytophthora megakarya]
MSLGAGGGSGGGGGGGSGGAGGGAAAGAAAQTFRGSSKPPRFEGTFELYRVELELYLDEREAWAVVSGDEVRHPTDADQQGIFDKRNRLAKATILRGLRGCQDDEVNKICMMTTAKEMWDTVVADKTQRDYSYVALLRAQLYSTKHVKGQTMTEYLQTMNRLRQQLCNMGVAHRVDDDEMLRVLTMGVSLTHPELVEQFDLPARQGTPLTLQQFTNALRSKDERLRMAEMMNGGSAAPQVVMSTTSEPKAQEMKYKGSGGAWKKRKCYHCGKAGHIRQQCWHYLNKNKKVTSDDKKNTEKKEKPNKNKKK